MSTQHKSINPIESSNPKVQFAFFDENGQPIIGLNGILKNQSVSDTDMIQEGINALQRLIDTKQLHILHYPNIRIVIKYKNLLHIFTLNKQHQLSPIDTTYN